MKSDFSPFNELGKPRIRVPSCFRSEWMEQRRKIAELMDVVGRADR
jgi:hypothetical protein